MKHPILAQRFNNKGVTIMELAVVVCAFMLIIAALTPFVNMAKARSRRLGCAENLRKISLGLHGYAAEHNGAFPGALGELYPKYVAGEHVLDCPATRRIGTNDNPDYKYRAGLSEEASPREIIAEDDSGNHGKGGGNLLRIDGSVEWSG